jgi:iron complex outermembrane receptor protein
VKTFTTLYRTQPASRRSTFAISSTATGCAILMLAAGHSALAAAPAAAPAAGDSDLEEVVVTGIRAAIESAIATKKNADTIVESISAEDIGKLPDTTIAESLARLPGVTTQRDKDGNATTVSIRGLGPDFNGYLLNGREQTSTGDSRAVDLSVYPAELIGGATVYKSGDAGLMTAGLAGTIDNKLVEPLAYHNMIISAQADKTRNTVGVPSLPEGKGNRYSLSYIDQFADRKLGIAIGFVHSKTDSSSLGATGSWDNAPPIYSDNHVTQIANDGAGPLPDNIRVPFAGGLSFESAHKSDKRDGGALILEFVPNDAFRSEFDGYYAKIKTATKKVMLKRGSNGADITNATISGGVVTSGTFDMPAGSYAMVEQLENIFDDDTIQSYGWKNELKFSDAWSGMLDLNHNSAKRVERDIEAYAGIATADKLSFTNGGASIPSFSFANPLSYTDPSVIRVHDMSGWSGTNYRAADLPPGDPNVGRTVPQAGYSKGPTVTDKLDAVRLEFKHELGTGVVSNYVFGANYTKRSKERITDEGLVVSTTNDGYDTIAFPGSSYVEKNIAGTGLDMLTFDPQAGLWPGARVLRKYNDDILSKTWTVEEKVTTLYGKLNLNSSLGEMPLRGNVGLQLVRTDQSSAGFRADVNSNVTLTNPAGSLKSDGSTYNDVLPSVNLTGDLGNGKLLRFGASIQIARPNLTDMRNSLGVSVDTNAANSTFGTLVGSAGNPHLQPFKAEAYDLSFEKYFQTKAYFSAAVFYKNLYTYIANATNRGGYDFTEIAPQLGLTIPPAGALGTFTTPVNGHGGSIMGFELAASLPFGMFTDWLDGFGLTGSYSNTSSTVGLPNLIGRNPTQQVPNDNLRIPLPGLSHINEKLVAYYERWGFSAFYAINKRSDYIGSVSNTTVGGYPTLVKIFPQTWVSAQVGYEFQSGPVKGLGLRFEGNNLNKPEYKEYNGSSTNVNKTGATYFFKVSYKFQN